MLTLAVVVAYGMIAGIATKVMREHYCDEGPLGNSYAVVGGVLWPLAATMMISHLIICLVMILPHWMITGLWPWES